MRVGIDGTALALTSGGLRRYTEELVRALRAEFPEDRFETLSSEGRRLWWSLRLPMKLQFRGFDVFHGTNFEAWNSIAKAGLSKMKRNHIHLAQNVPGESGVISGEFI